MARYAGGGKNGVESCRSIDVLEWHRRGYLRSPRWLSWAWSRDGERLASINVETQRHAMTLKYRSRSYGEGWSDVEQRVAIEWTSCRFGGERPWFVCSVAGNRVYCGRRVNKLYGAGRLFACRLCYRLVMHWRTYERLRRVHDVAEERRSRAWWRERNIISLAEEVSQFWVPKRLNLKVKHDEA